MEKRSLLPRSNFCPFSRLFLSCLDIVDRAVQCGHEFTLTKLLISHLHSQFCVAFCQLVTVYNSGRLADEVLRCVLARSTCGKRLLFVFFGCDPLTTSASGSISNVRHIFFDRGATRHTLRRRLWNSSAIEICGRLISFAACS